MFGSLRKKLEEITAQVNPFDGGKTASTVRASRQQAPPAQTINRPNQSFANKVFDQVSSNTQADQYRRQQQQRLVQDSTRGTDEAMRNLQKQALTGQVDKNVAAAKIRALGTSNVQPNTAENVLKPTTPAQIAGQKVVDTTMNRKVAPVALGVGRSVAGTVGGVAGLYDLASPGDGVNRVSKVAVKAGDTTDRVVKENSYNQIAYKGAQAGGDLATFAIGGAAGKALPGVSKGLSYADRLAKPVSNVVGKGATSLASKGFAGRVAGKSLQNITKPGYQAANAGFTALQAGKEASHGTKVTPMGVTTNLVAGGVGFPVAGAVVGQTAKPVINAGVNQLRKTNLIRPSKLNPNEVADLARLNDTAKTGAIMEDGVYQRGVQAAQKAGVDYNNPTAVDDLLGKHRTFDTISSQRKQAIDEAKLRLANPRPLNNEIGAVGKNVDDPLDALRREAGKLDEQVRSYDTKKNFKGFRESDEGRQLFELETKRDDINKIVTRLDNPVDKVTVSQIENMGRKAILEGNVTKADLVKQFNKMGKEKFPSNQKRYIDDTYGSVEAYYDDVVAKGEAGVVDNFSQLAGVPTSPKFEDFYNRTVLNRNKTGLNRAEPKINKVERKITETEQKRTETAPQPQPAGKDVNKGAPIAEPKSTVLNRNEPKTDTPILGPKLKRSQLSGRTLDTPTKELTGDPIADSLGMSSKTLEEAQNFTNADASRPADFNAVAGASGSKNSKRLADAINNDNAITAAAIKAQDDGSEINFFAKKDQNNRSIGVERFNPKYHRIESGFVVDKDGTILGNHIKVDETGVQVNVGGDIINMDSILGNQANWRGSYRVSETMDRNIMRNAPDKKTYLKTRRFLIDNKNKNEANFKTELRSQRQQLSDRTNQVKSVKPLAMSKDEFNSDIFDFIEGKIGNGDIKAKYGKGAEQIISYKKDTRKLYDQLLDRVNEVYARYGEAPVPKRKDYITHINELMDKPNFAGEMFGQLENSFLGEGMQKTRGEVPGSIAGRTENFEPRRRWNRFFQQRKGGDYTKDPFKAVDSYLEPTLYNIHMTESAVRARAVESFFRTSSELKAMDKTGVSDALKDELVKYSGENSKLVTGFQEYANALAGKTQRLDRQIVDSSDTSAAALRGWQGLQRIGGRATILGNVQSIVAQTLNQPLALADAGAKNYIKGIASSLTGNTPIAKSPFITARRTQTDSPLRGTGQKVLDVGGVPLRKMEMEMVELTWNSEYHKAVQQGYKGQDAVLEADRLTEQVVAGRGIADRPEAYRSTAINGLLQYTLEVAATNKKVWQDFTPAQKAKYVAAVFATNQVVGGVTGYQPLPDYLGATIDSFGDFADSEDKRNAGQKAISTGQRYLGVTAAMNPVTSAATTALLSQDQREKIFGPDSQLARFEGTAAPIQVVRNVANAGINLTEKNFTEARNSTLKVLPFGNQVRKTWTGAETLARGFAVDSNGNPTFAAPTSAGGKAQTLVFGPTASADARDFYNKGQTSIKGKEDLAEIEKSTDKQKTVTEIQRRRQVEKLAKGEKTEYRNEEGLLATIGAYASAVKSDPATAIDRILSGQTIRRTNNGAIVVERLPASESQKIKSERGGKNAEMKLDHTVPLQLGGSNKQDNLKLVTTEEWSKYTAVENLLGERLRTNVIDANTAKKLITDFKSGKLSAEEVATSVGGGKIKNKDKKTATLVAESGKTKTTKTKKPLDNLPPNMNGYDVQTLERFNGITTAEKDEIIRKEADAEYKLKLAEYERDKKLGSITSVENIKRQKTINKLKVGSTYDRNTRDAFNLNKTELSEYLATEEKGVDKKKLAEQILAYDDALTKAGIQSKNKFRDKYGNVAISPKKSGGGKKGGKGKGKKGKFDYTKNLFASTGSATSGSVSKSLRAILENAQKSSSKK